MVTHHVHKLPGSAGILAGECPSSIHAGKDASAPRVRQNGFLMTEMLVALAILLGALLPLAYSLASEKRLARAAYQRAVAMELVDGEMEILAAGEWRAMPAGVHEDQVHAAARLKPPTCR